MDSVKVHSPATVSNVVCGFDCLGFALAEPFDEIEVRRIPEREVRIRHLDGFGLPEDPALNIAGPALQALMRAAGVDHGFAVEFRKAIKPGSGIGSSAASVCGVVTAADHLLGKRFSKNELIRFAMAGEALASGDPHADNLAPCIYGGFTLVRSNDPLEIVELDHPDLFATVIHPQIEVRTSDARALLPREIPLASAVKNWSNLGAFVAGSARGDTGLMSRSMKDEIVEPVRAKLIPMFAEVREAALAAGAIGAGISGSGPSMFVLSSERETAEAAASAIDDVYRNTQIEFNIYVSAISPHGVRIVS